MSFIFTKTASNCKCQAEPRHAWLASAELRKDWLSCCNQSLSTLPLPPDESPDMHYEDDSPFPVDGGDGDFEAAPLVYLMTYWMARFHNVTEAATIY